MAGLSVLTPFPTSHASPVIASVGEGGGTSDLELRQRHATQSSI